MKLSCKKGTSYLIFIYLCPPKWFRIRIQRTMINREPGVNPGQSRCCETPIKFPIRTYCHCLTPHNENAGRHRK